MGALKVFLAGVGAALLALSKWWEERKRRERQQDAQARADRIAADPGAEWVRMFKQQAAPADKAGAGKSDRPE